MTDEAMTDEAMTDEAMTDSIASGKYFIKDASDNLIGLLPKFYAGIKIDSEHLLQEITESGEKLLLPESYYNNRPEYITNVSEFNFDFVPGIYGKNSEFTMQCEFKDNQAYLIIRRVFTPHIKASISGDKLSGLSHTSVDDIIIEHVDAETDTGFSGEYAISVSEADIFQSFDVNPALGMLGAFGAMSAFNNANATYQDYTINFIKGEAKLAVPMPRNHMLYARLSSGDDSKTHLNTHIIFPESITKMRELRRNRDRLLSSCDWLIIRHMSQASNKSLNNSDYAQLQIYMQALRDLPESASDLDNITWPEAPEFMQQGA